MDEECDDGNSNNADGCSAACGIECTGEATECGDFDNNQTLCGQQIGCNYRPGRRGAPGTCNGAAKACWQFNAAGNSEGCIQQGGCTWEEGRIPGT